MPKEIWIWSWDTGNIIHICRPWRRSALWRPQTETTLTVHLTAPAPSLLNDLAGSYPFGMMGDEGFAAEGDVYQSAGALAEPEEENGFSTLGTGMWKLKTYVEGEYSVFELQ